MKLSTFARDGHDFNGCLRAIFILTVSFVDFAEPSFAQEILFILGIHGKGVLSDWVFSFNELYFFWQFICLFSVKPQSNTSRHILLLLYFRLISFCWLWFSWILFCYLCFIYRNDLTFGHFTFILFFLAHIVLFYFFIYLNFNWYFSCFILSLLAWPYLCLNYFFFDDFLILFHIDWMLWAFCLWLYCLSVLFGSFGG